jgi:opacity protein-like surface antigen
MNFNNFVKNISFYSLTMGLVGMFSLYPTPSRGLGNDSDIFFSDTVEMAEKNDGQREISTAAETVPSDSNNGIYSRYISGRLQLGTRSVYRRLTHSDSGAKGGGQGSGTFLGSIYALNENQDELPVQPFLVYYFTKYIGLELAYDSIEAETVAYSDGYVKTDGNVSLGGPTLTLMGRYPNHTSFTPYVGIGIGFFQGDFDPDPAWALGYSNPIVYQSLGSPVTLCDGTSREMEIDNTVGILVITGVTYQVYQKWSVDLSAEYIKADADAVFRSYQYGESFVNDPGSFPLSNVTLRIGIVYEF